MELILVQLLLFLTMHLTSVDVTMPLGTSWWHYIKIHKTIHLQAAEYLFNAFKVAAGLNIMHATYSQLEIPVYVAKIATYNWAHQMLVDILSTQVGALAQPLIVQVHMIAKEAHMTALIAINTVLKEFNSVFILIPGVIDEIPKFREAWRHLEQQIGAELFPYAKAIRHQEAARVTPSAFPMLASAALYHTTETSTIMKNYRQGHPIPGSIPETKLVDVFHQKLKRKSQSTFTDEQWAILNSCRKLHRIWSRLHFSHLQLH